MLIAVLHRLSHGLLTQTHHGYAISVRVRLRWLLAGSQTAL
jgi:hypothetical protein